MVKKEEPKLPFFPFLPARKGFSRPARNHATLTEESRILQSTEYSVLLHAHNTESLEEVGLGQSPQKARSLEYNIIHMSSLHRQTDNGIKTKASLSQADIRTSKGTSPMKAPYLACYSLFGLSVSSSCILRP